MVKMISYTALLTGFFSIQRIRYNSKECKDLEEKFKNKIFYSHLKKFFDTHTYIHNTTEICTLLAYFYITYKYKSKVHSNGWKKTHALGY